MSIFGSWSRRVSRRKHFSQIIHWPCSHLSDGHRYRDRLHGFDVHRRDLRDGVLWYVFGVLIWAVAAAGADPVVVLMVLCWGGLGAALWVFARTERRELRRVFWNAKRHRRDWRKQWLETEARSAALRQDVFDGQGPRRDDTQRQFQEFLDSAPPLPGRGEFLRGPKRLESSQESGTPLPPAQGNLVLADCLQILAGLPIEGVVTRESPSSIRGYFNVAETDQFCLQLWCRVGVSQLGGLLSVHVWTDTNYWINETVHVHGYHEGDLNLALDRRGGPAKRWLDGLGYRAKLRLGTLINGLFVVFWPVVPLYEVCLRLIRSKKQEQALVSEHWQWGHDPRSGDVGDLITIRATVTNNPDDLWSCDHTAMSTYLSLEREIHTAMKRLADERLDRNYYTCLRGAAA